MIQDKIMKPIFCHFSIILLYLTLFNPIESICQKYRKKPNPLLVDTNCIFIIPIGTKLKNTPDSFWYFFKQSRHITNTKCISLTKNDIYLMDKLLKIFVDSNNQNLNSTIKRDYLFGATDKEMYEINLNKYRRQYIPYIDSSGHKKVWANYFCEHYYDKTWPKYINDFFADWKNRIVFADGGSVCYFRIVFDLTDKKRVSVEINAEM